MGISVISDIHIRPHENSGRETFEKFSSHSVVQNSADIVFLGDIFDLLFGSYPEYLKQYSFFFDFIFQMLEQGKNIHYIEGNHDLHLESLFASTLKKSTRKNSGFHYYKGGFLKEFHNQKIYFSHGDDIDTTEHLYFHYRRFISSSFMRLMTENFIPYQFVERLGHQAAKASRKRNQSKYSSETFDTTVKEKTRLCTRKAWNLVKFDVLVCGHTHIKDYYHSPEGFLYVNNGYASLENTFIYIDDHVSFIELD